MENNDNECFKWSVTAAVYPSVRDKERISKKLKVNAKKFNWDGIEFPVTLKQISLFEKNNEECSVNVYGYEKEVYPLRISKCTTRENVINLLLISNEETNHYCWIREYE